MSILTFHLVKPSIAALLFRILEIILQYMDISCLINSAPRLPAVGSSASASLGRTEPTILPTDFNHIISDVYESGTSCVKPGSPLISEE